MEETHDCDVEQKKPDAKHCTLFDSNKIVFILYQAQVIKEIRSQGISYSWKEAATGTVNMGASGDQAMWQYFVF